MIGGVKLSQNHQASRSGTVEVARRWLLGRLSDVVRRRRRLLLRRGCNAQQNEARLASLGTARQDHHISIPRLAFSDARGANGLVKLARRTRAIFLVEGFRESSAANELNLRCCYRFKVAHPAVSASGQNWNGVEAGDGETLHSRRRGG